MYNAALHFSDDKLMLLRGKVDCNMKTDHWRFRDEIGLFFYPFSAWTFSNLILVW